MRLRHLLASMPKNESRSKYCECKKPRPATQAVGEAGFSPAPKRLNLLSDSVQTERQLNRYCLEQSDMLQNCSEWYAYPLQPLAELITNSNKRFCSFSTVCRGLVTHSPRVGSNPRDVFALPATETRLNSSFSIDSGQTFIWWSRISFKDHTQLHNIHLVSELPRHILEISVIHT